MKVTVFWDVAPCSLWPSVQAVVPPPSIGSLALTRSSPSSPLARPRSCLVGLVPVFQTSFPPRGLLIALLMEAAGTFETSVIFTRLHGAAALKTSCCVYAVYFTTLSTVCSIVLRDRTASQPRRLQSTSAVFAPLLNVHIAYTVR
jgi:hypothetical protein